MKSNSIEEILEYLKFQGNVRQDELRQPILATYRFLINRLREEELWEPESHTVQAGEPNGYCFKIIDDDEPDVIAFGIVKKSFWDKHHYLEDTSFGLNPPPNLPEKFDEVAESIFQFLGDDWQTGRDLLIEAGFIEVR
jgi:hypothetical protein